MKRLLYFIANVAAVVGIVFAIFLVPEIRTVLNPFLFVTSFIAVVRYMVVFLQNHDDPGVSPFLFSTTVSVFGCSAIMQSLIGMAGIIVGELGQFERGLYLFAGAMGALAVLVAHTSLPQEPPRRKRNLGRRI